MSQEFKDDLIKAGLSAGIAGVGSYLFLGEANGQTNLPFISYSVPTSLAIGTAVGGASLVSNMAHDYVLPHINKSAKSKLTNVESALLQIGTAGAATSIILVYGSNMPPSNLSTSFLVGSASAIAGEYVGDVALGKSNMLF